MDTDQRRPFLICVRLFHLWLVSFFGVATALAVDVEVVGLDGVTTRGTLVRVAPEIVLSTGAGERSFGWADLLEMRPIGQAAGGESATDAPWRVMLADGSRFAAKLGGSADEGVTATLASGTALRMKMSDVRWALSIAAGAATATRVSEISAEADAVDDAVLLLRGAELIVLRGMLKRMDERGVLLLWKERELPIAWDKLVGVVVARPTARELPVMVRASGGEAFAGRVTGGDENGVVLQGSIATLGLPWSRIERIEARSTRMMFLSQMTPQSYEHQPFFSKRWEPVFDRTFSGRPIVVAGQQYPRGIVMHSQSRVMYAINGAARQFAAIAGILDEVGPRGDVSLKVIGDGRVLWEADNVRGGEPPREVLVDVERVMVLELVVEFGAGMDLSDQAVWAMARVIR